MKKTINLRSDTVTRPTEAMRHAMAAADVGDDYYRADPTVIALEERAAALLGKEAAMMTFSATMANLVSVLSQARRGQSVILEASSHIYNNEGGGIASFGGVFPRTVQGVRGRMTPEQVKAAVFPKAVLHPQTGLLCLENTHNAAGGTCLSPAQTRALADTAHALELKVHLDGARLFNSAVAQRVAPRELVESVDSVTVCLTKGLGCPVGALVLGSREFVTEARRWRQAAGGGMRQAGVFAAAGLLALDTMVERLAEDHANAKRLALLLAEAGLRLDPPPEEVETNILYAEIPAELMDAGAFVERRGAEGVQVNPPRGGKIRLITHLDVSAEDVETAGAAVRRVLASA
ncbi:MAG: low specificity L-threonine aldolase [Gemmatimonadetes bacterium]|nr:low specificity L-threonine aldolase [Gemmatimonadota bacterium]